MKLSHRKLIKQLTANTAALAMPEGRRVGQPGHEKAIRYLTERLAELKRRQPPPSLVAVEAANLVQMHGLDLVDLTVMVTAPRDERLRRVMARDGLSSAEVQRRLVAQEEQGIGDFEADRVLVTDGDVAASREQAQRLYQELVGR